ncbi:polyadenylate-binding protein-interacting protein 2 [Esox lucius]|nr:polyadenylate-binding protein-interacting protein 2 [Esox lucius]ACO13518.1 Polyadenylate-binding protein-interacting protein 2 [Esox lucius]
MKDPSRINNTPSLSNIDLILQHGQFINDDNPFAEYMWMENEEEFNRQFEEELWEEEFIEQCFQEMLEEEEYEWFIPARDLPPTLSQIQDQLHLLAISDTCITDSLVVNSNLNPEAQEFIPRLKH